MSFTIALFGLGKLGAPLGALLADRGNRVIGVDVNAAVVNCVNAGFPHLPEPGYAELLAKVKGLFTATVSPLLAVSRSDLSIVLVPTPSGADGRYVNDYVLTACREIATALTVQPKRHLVVIASTVMPGSCAGPIRAALPECCGLAYSPEFVALGDVLAGFGRPDFVLLGADDERSREEARYFYSSLYGHPVPIHAMSLVSAEIAKIALNAYITMKMTFANELGRFCAAVAGADVDAITAALGEDRRIGGEYLRAGAPYGGPCFPRDNRAFANAALDAGMNLRLPPLVDLQNRAIPLYVASLVREYFPAGHVGILGLSYKPNTPLTEESLGAALCEVLQNDYPILTTYDPLATLPNVPYAESVEALLRITDCVVITQDRPEWHDLPARPGQAFVDCWRVLDWERIRAQGGVYIPLWRKT